MSINANITRVVSASAVSPRHTGSFTKLYILETTVFERIEFGTDKGTKFIDSYGQPGTKLEVSNVFDTVLGVKATAGTYVDGPIAAFNLASGGCLAYNTKSNP